MKDSELTSNACLSNLPSSRPRHFETNGTGKIHDSKNIDSDSVRVERLGNMANKIDPKDVIPLREALNMEIMINQALIDLLVTKGIITQEELMAKIEVIRRELPSGTS